MTQNNESVKQTIKSSVTFLSFAKEFGPKVSVVKCTSKSTGEIFKALAFQHTDDIKEDPLFVSFSSNLGELTPQEIVAQKNDLQVVQFEESGNYCLCKKGKSDKWQAVEGLF